MGSTRARRLLGPFVSVAISIPIGHRIPIVDVAAVAHVVVLLLVLVLAPILSLSTGLVLLATPTRIAVFGPVSLFGTPAFLLVLEVATGLGSVRAVGVRRVVGAPAMLAAIVPFGFTVVASRLLAATAPGAARTVSLLALLIVPEPSTALLALWLVPLSRLSTLVLLPALTVPILLPALTVLTVLALRLLLSVRKPLTPLVTTGRLLASPVRL